jgi:hypothetical protein
VRTRSAAFEHNPSGHVGLTALGLGSLLGLCFYTYAGFAIVARASLDCYGAKPPITTGVFGVAIGSVPFGLRRWTRPRTP